MVGFLCFSSAALSAQTQIMIDSLEELIEGSRDAKEIAAWNLELSKITYLSEVQQSFRYANASLKIACLNGLKTEMGKGHHMLSILYFMVQDYESAVLHCDSAKTQFRSSGDSSGLASVYNLSGVINLTRQDYGDALGDLEVAKSFFLDLRDSAALSKVWSNIGRIYYLKGHYTEALNHYRKSLDLVSVRDDKVSEAKTLNNIAVIYNDRLLYNRALEYFLKAKLVHMEVQDFVEVLRANLNVAKVYNALSRHDRAYDVLKSEVDTNHFFEQQPALHRDYIQELALSVRGLGEIERALALNSRALAMAQENSDTTNMVGFSIFRLELLCELGLMDKAEALDINLNNMVGRRLGTVLIAKYNVARAQLCKAKRQYSEAEELLHSAEIVFEESKRLVDLKGVYKQLQILYKSQNDFQKTVHYYEKLTAVSESMFNSLENQKLSQFEIREQFEGKLVRDSLESLLVKRRKNAQIALEQERVLNRSFIAYASAGTTLLLLLLVGVVLRSRSKIRRQKAAIEKRNTQIEWLLKEIHHRVKNNMQIVSSLMSIQSRKLKDEASKNLIRESQNRIKSMSLVHESLYLAEDLSQIEIGPFISRIAEHVNTSLKASHQEIILNIETDEAHLNAEQAVPLGIIVNELSGNAYKHAFVGRDRGTLHIEFRKREDGFELRVGDDGPIFDHRSETEFSQNSIGLALVRSLAEDQLNGSFVIAQASVHKFTIQFGDIKNVA